MLTVIATIRVNEGAEQRFLAATGPLIRATRAEAGCSLYELNRSNTAPGTFVFYEKWADDAALERHRATPHLEAFIAAAGGDFAGPLEVEFLTTVA